ncbi:ATPase [Candidatus Poribacteria bacterium]|nr:ATPase [Candidatus Poribacteria bacterium]
MNINVELRAKITFVISITMAVVAIIAVASLLINIGGISIFDGQEAVLHVIDWVIITIFIAEIFLRWLIAPSKLYYLRHNWLEFALFLFFLLQLLLFRKLINIFSVTKGYIVIIQTYIIITLLLKFIQGSSRIMRLNLKPEQLVLLSFLFVILAGAALLKMPNATPSDKPISTLDALFTATSATCVTGLILRDTGSEFTLLGQIIVLLLIQVGGLGLMTVTTSFALILGQSMGIRERMLIGDALSSQTLGKVSRTVIYIVVLTLIIEAIGATALYLAWANSDIFYAQIPNPGRHPVTVLYYSVFHAVSAFCNAGFSLFKDNLMYFHNHIAENVAVTFLIISGGLGFGVIVNVLRYDGFYKVFGSLTDAKGLRFARLTNAKGLWFKKRGEKLTLHSKVVLITTGILVFVATILILGIEWNKSLSEFSFKGKLLSAYFQSVTPRTAGFNTIDISQLTSACYFLMIILMFIGASPGSTGGGIKTSTLTTLLSSLRAVLQGKQSVEMFCRMIPSDVINKALVIVVASLLMLSVFAFILLITEEGEPIKIIFELFSAYGTVGLSAGLTPQLSAIGKIIIIITMFIGRIGPLTLALAIRRRRETGNYEYPSESVMIG